MPLVISHKSKRKYFIPSEEVLAEILGHDNFDGEDWAVGDSIVFEDGTDARIIQEPGEQFHVWSDPQPADLERVLSEINRYHPVQPLDTEQFPDWDALFSQLKEEEAARPSGCFTVVMLLALLVGATLTQNRANKQVDTNLRPAAELTQFPNSDPVVSSHLRSRSQVGHL